MPVRDCQTEHLILDSAMKVLFVEGRINATMQDIAGTAGVSRTVINYYYRSRNALVNAALSATRREFKRKGDQILMSDLPFREKTEKFVGNFLENQGKYPYLEAFVTMDHLRKKLIKNSSSSYWEKSSAPLKNYMTEIKAEMEKGTMQERDPLHFMLDIFSLMVYPIIMKPINMALFSKDEEEYQRLLGERKEEIMQLMFPSSGNKKS